MWGNKQKEIETLTKDVEYWRTTARCWQTDYENSDKARRDAVDNLVTAVNQCRDLEGQNDTLHFALNESKELNRALEEENKDLVRLVELYKAVLGTLRVNIGLPARKK